MLFLTVSSAHGLAVISYHSTIRPPGYPFSPMLAVTKKGILEDRYHVSREGEEIARLTTGAWPRKGTIVIGNENKDSSKELRAGGRSRKLS